MDESGRKECSFETCGSDLPPIPLMIQRQNLPAKAEAAMKRSEPHQSIEAIMKTNFTCDGMPYIPGLYADMDADCQIFHLCMKGVVDHFTCPKGTAFDQKYLVCRTEGKKNCKQSPSFYVRNVKVLESFQIFWGLDEFDDYDNEHFYLDLLRNIQNADPSLLDRDIIRALILLQFVEASLALPNVRIGEHFNGLRRQGRQMKSKSFENVLRTIINFIFPILPVNYTSDPKVHEQNLYAKSSDQRAAEQDSRFSDSWKNNQGSDAEIDRSSIFSEAPDQRAVQIVEIILETIGDVFGRIEGISRRFLVQNHINYLNTLSGFFSR